MVQTGMELSLHFMAFQRISKAKALNHGQMVKLQRPDTQAFELIL